MNITCALILHSILPNLPVLQQEAVTVKSELPPVGKNKAAPSKRRDRQLTAFYHATVFKRRICDGMQGDQIVSSQTPDLIASALTMPLVGHVINSAERQKLRNKRMLLTRPQSAKSDIVASQCAAFSVNMCKRANDVIKLHSSGAALSLPILEATLGQNQEVIEATKRRFTDNFVNDAYLYLRVCASSSLSHQTFIAQVLYLKYATLGGKDAVQAGSNPPSRVRFG